MTDPMAESRCDLTDLLTTQCAHCRSHPDPEPEPHQYGVNIHTPPTTAATYRSRCPGCDETIQLGDTITLTGGEWVCADCVP